MNTNLINTTSSNQKLKLPEPDFDNITVLTSQLPNKPILPWNRFDSPVFNQKDIKSDTNQEEQPAIEIAVNNVQEKEKIDKEIAEAQFNLSLDFLKQELEQLFGELERHKKMIHKLEQLPQNSELVLRIDTLRKEMHQLSERIEIQQEMIYKLEELL